jgi:drug/metabolite transporter (DMT)-like permease
MTSLTTHENLELPLLKGYLYAALIVAIWTGFILVSRVGGISPLTAWDVIAVRYATAAVILLPFWWFRRRVPLVSGRLILLASVGGLGYAVLAFVSFKLVPAAHAVVLLAGLLPFAVALFAWLLLGEVLSANRLVGLAIIASGVACLVMYVFSGKAAVMHGDLLMVGASACWACYTVLLRRWAVSPWDATIGVTLLTALMYLPFYLIALPKHMVSASWSDIATQAVYQGLIATIIQMVLYVRTIELIGPTRLGMLMALVPGLAGIAAVPLLNEPLSPWVLAGLVLACLGAWFGNLRNIINQRKKPCLT